MPRNREYTQPHIQGYLKPCHRWEMNVGILESSIIAEVMDDGIPLFCCCLFFSSSFGSNLMCLSENDKIGGLAVSACALTWRVMVLKWEIRGQVSVATMFLSRFPFFFPHDCPTVAIKNWVKYQEKLQGYWDLSIFLSIITHLFVL